MQSIFFANLYILFCIRSFNIFFFFLFYFFIFLGLKVSKQDKNLDWSFFFIVFVIFFFRIIILINFINIYRCIYFTKIYRDR